jgi:hypothetical protein
LLSDIVDTLKESARCTLFPESMLHLWMDLRFLQRQVGAVVGLRFLLLRFEFPQATFLAQPLDLFTLCFGVSQALLNVGFRVHISVAGHKLALPMPVLLEMDQRIGNMT